MQSENNTGRVCNRCKVYKTWENFAINFKGINNRKSICKHCSNKSAKELTRRRRKENPEGLYLKRREKLLNTKYGICFNAFNEMLESQNKSCAICSAKENKVGKNFFVDHCHKTEKIRGLLCYHCNTLLGMAFDSPEILRKAADYVQKHK